jgi:hypothetical protein
VLSSQVLEFEVDIDPQAVPGPRQITVFNPDGESARSSIAVFNVTVPELAGEVPHSNPAHSSAPWNLYD